MIEQKRQQEALELVMALEQMAMETGMKLRIVDALKEREKALQSPIPDEQWEKELLMIDEAVTYMEKQLLGGKADIIVNDSHAVSRDEVRNRIHEIWALCRETNRKLQNAYRQTQAVSRQKLESDMMDWTNVSANYEMMSVPFRFHARCHETGQVYKQQMDGLVLEYVDESAEEYDRVMNRIKGLIASLSREQVSVTARDIYEKWDCRQESIRQNLKKNAEQLEKGETDLARFGQTHTKPMERIIRQKRRKQIFYSWIPLLVVLALFLAMEGISCIKTNLSQSEKTAVQEEGFAEKLTSAVIDKSVDKISVYIAGNLFKIFATFLLPLAILLMLAWILWMRHTRVLYRRWIIKDLESYIKPQVEGFWRESIIFDREEACFRQMEDMIGICYDDIFRDLLGEEFGMERDDSPEMRMKELRRKWNGIKYM